MSLWKTAATIAAGVAGAYYGGGSNPVNTGIAVAGAVGSLFGQQASYAAAKAQGEAARQAAALKQEAGVLTVGQKARHATETADFMRASGEAAIGQRDRIWSSRMGQLEKTNAVRVTRTDQLIASRLAHVTGQAMSRSTLIEGQATERFRMAVDATDRLFDMTRTTAKEGLAIREAQTVERMGQRVAVAGMQTEAIMAEADGEARALERAGKSAQIEADAAAGARMRELRGVTTANLASAASRGIAIGGSAAYSALAEMRSAARTIGAQDEAAQTRIVSTYERAHDTRTMAGRRALLAVADAQGDLMGEEQGLERARFDVDTLIRKAAMDRDIETLQAGMAMRQTIAQAKQGAQFAVDDAKFSGAQQAADVATDNYLRTEEARTQRWQDIDGMRFDLDQQLARYGLESGQRLEDMTLQTYYDGLMGDVNAGAQGAAADARQTNILMEGLTEAAGSGWALWNDQLEAYRQRNPRRAAG